MTITHLHGLFWNYDVLWQMSDSTTTKLCQSFTKQFPSTLDTWNKHMVWELVHRTFVFILIPFITLRHWYVHRAQEAFIHILSLDTILYSHCQTDYFVECVIVARWTMNNNNLPLMWIYIPVNIISKWHTLLTI